MQLGCETRAVVRVQATLPSNMCMLSIGHWWGGKGPVQQKAALPAVACKSFLFLQLKWQVRLLPLQKLAEWYPVTVALSANLGRLEDSSVTKLYLHFFSVEQPWTVLHVGSDAPENIPRSFLQQSAKSWFYSNQQKYGCLLSQMHFIIAFATGQGDPCNQILNLRPHTNARAVIPDEVRSASHHLGQKVHQWVAEVGGDSLLGPTLTGGGTRLQKGGIFLNQTDAGGTWNNRQTQEAQMFTNTVTEHHTLLSSFSSETELPGKFQISLNFSANMSDNNEPKSTFTQHHFQKKKSSSSQLRMGLAVKWVFPNLLMYQNLKQSEESLCEMTTAEIKKKKKNICALNYPCFSTTKTIKRRNLNGILTCTCTE